jgi:hypothetical protein
MIRWNGWECQLMGCNWLHLSQWIECAWMGWILKTEIGWYVLWWMNVSNEMRTDVWELIGTLIDPNEWNEFLIYECNKIKYNRWNALWWMNVSHKMKTLLSESVGFIMNLTQLNDMNFFIDGCQAIGWSSIDECTQMDEWDPYDENLSLRIDRDDFFKRELTQVNKMKSDLWMWSNKMKFHGWHSLLWMNVTCKMIFHGWNSLWWMNVTC